VFIINYFFNNPNFLTKDINLFKPNERASGWSFGSGSLNGSKSGTVGFGLVPGFGFVVGFGEFASGWSFGSGSLNGSKSGMVGLGLVVGFGLVVGSAASASLVIFLV